jgi:hypothetical protein
MTTTFILTALGIRKIVQDEVRTVLRSYSNIAERDREAIERDVGFRLAARLTGAVQERETISPLVTKQ